MLRSAIKNAKHLAKKELGVFCFRGGLTSKILPLNCYETMIDLKRTDPRDTGFQSLIRELDKDLAARNSEENSFFMQFNKTDNIRRAVMAYVNGRPAGCGAIKHYDEGTMEIKRMFVPAGQRGQGIASSVLKELEKWCLELGYKRCILETGQKQPEAIALYHKNGYKIIPNFGQYTDVASSICFEKVL